MKLHRKRRYAWIVTAAAVLLMVGFVAWDFWEGYHSGRSVPAGLLTGMGGCVWALLEVLEFLVPSTADETESKRPFGCI
jgi:hypothetical protein